ncbi:MAG: spore coat protein CotJB [Clostridia bacterium]|nr:spore coat protein CotJB [Clostridia bacterium]
MSEREMLLKKLSAQQFAAWETGLFLDTHPTCSAALKAHKEYVAAAKEAKKEYNEKYGMLTHNCPHEEDKWQWVCDPWPWDLEQGGR